jgi:hypothetical protein
VDVLVGVVAGAVLAAMTSWLGDKRRWRREDDLRTIERMRERELRWIDARRAAYVDFLRSARKAVWAVQAAAVSYSIAEETGGETSRQVGHDRFSDYAEARERMLSLMAEIDLLGPGNIASIARDVVQSIEQLGAASFEAGHLSPPDDELKAAEGFLEEFQRGARFALRTDHEVPPRTLNLS